MKRLGALAATAVLALAGAGCLATRTEPATEELQPRDLTPVTWLEAPKHAPVEIVRDGKSAAVVYVADPRSRENFDPHAYRSLNSRFPPVLPRMVHELVEVIALRTGATLERVDQAPSADRPAIVIGDCAETRRAGIDADKLPPEGFVVKTARNRVFLVGSTQATPVSKENDGTAWAVADFLERLVGVRWYWPAEYGGRSVPRSASLVIPPACYRDQPVFHVRTIHPDQAPLLPLSFAPHFDTPSDLTPRLLPFAPGVLPDGETNVTVVPQRALWRIGCSLPYQTVFQGGKHWDMAASAGAAPSNEVRFALNSDGKRDRSVLCYSAPETLAFVMDSCEQAWDKGHSVGLWLTPTSVNIWFPATPGLACHCSACGKTAAPLRDDRKLKTSLAEKHGDRRAFEIVEALVHERVIGLFVKRLCEAVKQRWPDKKVVYYPWDTSCPEGMEFPDNLVVHQFNVGYSLGLMQQPEVRRRQEARLRAWSGNEEVRCSVSTRHGAYGPSDWTYGPVQYPHLVQEFYRANRGYIIGSDVATYSLPCWTTAAPTFYVWMRVLWNPELDVDATLDEMCRRLFGAGAESARALLRLECERWEGSAWSRPLLQEAMRDAGEGSLRFPDDFHFRESWPPDVVARMRALRDQALVEMADDPRARLRDDATTRQARQAFLYWTWTFDEFVKESKAMYAPPSGAAEASAYPLKDVR